MFFKTIILPYKYFKSSVAVSLIGFRKFSKKGMKYARFCTIYDKTTKRLSAW